MKKRMVISGLWFISIWGIGGALHLFFDVPRALMLVPAVAIAAAWWIGLARYEASIETRRIQVGRISGYRAANLLSTSVK